MTPERLESIRFQAAYCAHFKEREGKDIDFAELLDQRDDLLAHIDAIRKAVSMRHCGCREVRELTKHRTS